MCACGISNRMSGALCRKLESRLSFVYASKHWHSLTQKSTCIEHAVWICCHLVKETTRCSISKVWWTSVHSPRCYFFASRRECTSCTFIVNGRGLTYRYLCHSRLVPDAWSQLKHISMHIKHTQIRAGKFKSCAFSNSLTAGGILTAQQQFSRATTPNSLAAEHWAVIS